MKQDIQDRILKRHAQCNYTCQYPGCEKPSTEIAHVISKGKYGRMRIKNYCFSKGLKLTSSDIDRIMHHDLNTYPTCKQHNDYMNLHISQDAKVESLIDEILDDIDKNVKS